MARIDEEEYELLKELDDKWKWIARDKDGVLGVYDAKVVKTKFHNSWIMAIKKKIDSSLFSFIQWEDEEPHNIAELIQEYEIENGTRCDFGKIKVVDIDTSKLTAHNGFIYVKESEELEVKKNIEWANGEIKKVRDLLNNKRYEEEVDDFTTGVLSGLKKALNILDELDEPEVLSQEWIDEHKKGVFMDGKGRKKNFVWVDDLQNLLVPTLSEMETVETTEEQAMEWLDNNDFYCHATAETVLANAVDKGELGYYGTKYSVVKKEPETVADVLTTFWESYGRLKEVMSMEVDELEDGIDSAISDIENGRINTYNSFDELLKELEE